jgi:hypothetical protein
MIPHTNTKKIMCSPLVCTIAKFVVLKRLLMIGCYKLYIRIQHV